MNEKSTTSKSPKSVHSTDILVVLGGSLLGLVIALVIIALFPSSPASTAAVTQEALKSLRSTLTSEAATMALPAVGDTQAYWFISRAGGIVAYVLLFLATFWGIAISGKVVKGTLKGSFVYGMHEFFPILALVFIFFHTVSLLGDHFIGFRPADILLPFGARYEPFWTGLGTLAMYLLAAVTASFYVRRWIGQRAWRLFHYVSYVAFFLALVHGVMAGSDTSLPAVRLMYIVTAALVLFATGFRVLTRPSSPSRATRGSRREVNLSPSH